MGRNKFKVAAMHDEIAATLAGLKSRNPPQGVLSQASATERPMQAVGRNAPIKPKRSIVADAPKQAVLNDKLENRRACKARPTKSTGSGSGRPFVPWCSK